MALSDTELHGVNYVFGFASADAPVIANFSCRKAELKFAPEVKAEAMNGEGHVESIALSKATKRVITGTFTGYISAGFSSNAIGNAFNFTVNGVSRYFIVDDISEPRVKGEYVEVAISATSKALVNGIAV